MYSKCNKIVYAVALSPLFHYYMIFISGSHLLARFTLPISLDISLKALYNVVSNFHSLSSGFNLIQLGDQGKSFSKTA